ncbi:hypothetical protein PVAP13_6KG395600 [Panicum virgatum]|uniref:Knottins-like domain-containing protein n=1 Tax=Panicum virgatum TaxID=38727 RepID=A0A8T0RJZ6_PANVG|nr:hypothetical protein PVAP13_6KG395600 [Panicum virgatum]
MASSRGDTKISASTAVILLLVIVAAEMGSVGAKRAACSHLSGVYPDWCINDSSCEEVCKVESHDNIGGACDDFPARCYCQTQCPP